MNFTKVSQVFFLSLLSEQGAESDHPAFPFVTYSLDKFLLLISYVAGTVLAARNFAVSRPDVVPAFTEPTFN